MSQNKQVWQENCLKPSLRHMPERQKNFTTLSGIDTQSLYTPEDVTTEYGQDLGYPGEYPFTRGVQPSMYRSRLWTMRQYSGYATAEDTNRRYRFLLEQGQTGLSIAFSLPTQMGYDSDHPLSRAEVGKAGVHLDTLKDMEILFEGIPLDKVSTSMTINATAPVILAMYIALAKKQGVDVARLDGTIQNDILKEYVARGTYIFPPRPSMRLTTDIIEYCHVHLPRWNTISISGYHMREAGATAIQELAFTLANGIAYVQAAIERGLDVDKFTGRLSFFFTCHNYFFEEIAKFRAARRMWARLMKERFGAKDPRSWMLRFHVQDLGSSFTAQQPLNNIIRGAVHALAIALGGAQSMHICSYDEAYTTPTEEPVTISLRTQQIIAHETGITDTIDPLGGSYYVEWLTNHVESEAVKYIAKIDSVGGAVAAIERGIYQTEVEEEAYRYQMDIESGKRVIVGINKFVSASSPMIKLTRVDQQVEDRQRQRLAEIKKTRDNVWVGRALQRLERVARSNENAMPALIECVEAYCSVGEICDILRNVFGLQRESLLFPGKRAQFL